MDLELGVVIAIMLSIIVTSLPFMVVKSFLDKHLFYKTK